MKKRVHAFYWALLAIYLFLCILLDQIYPVVSHHTSTAYRIWPVFLLELAAYFAGAVILFLRARLHPRTPARRVWKAATLLVAVAFLSIGIYRGSPLLPLRIFLVVQVAFDLAEALRPGALR